jgi:hypothetical protein
MPRRTTTTLGVALYVSFTMLAQAQSPKLSPQDAAATFNRLDLNVSAPCEIVWGFVIDRSRWKSNFVSRTIIEPGPVGELAKYRNRIGDTVIARNERTVAIVPYQRLVYLISDDDGVYAFASYELERNQKGCRLMLTIQLVAPLIPYSAAKVREDVERETQEIIEKDHLKIKALAEAEAMDKQRAKP